VLLATPRSPARELQDQPRVKRRREAQMPDSNAIWISTMMLAAFVLLTVTPSTY
jgi:hypothetical protein